MQGLAGQSTLAQAELHARFLPQDVEEEEEDADAEEVRTGGLPLPLGGGAWPWVARMTA